MQNNDRLGNVAASNYKNVFNLILLVIVFTAVASDPIVELMKGFPPFGFVKGLVNNPRSVLGYLLFKTPFIILAVMAGRFGSLKKTFNREAIICRSVGILFAFICYLCWFGGLAILIASGPGAVFGMVLYPLSSPVLIPILYYLGFSIGEMYLKTKSQ